MKILIDTDRFHGIEGQVVMHIEDAGFMVMIKEASCTFQINPQFVSPVSDAFEEVKGLSEVVDKPKVHGDDVDAIDDVASIQQGNDGMMVGERSEGAVRVNPCFEVDGMEVQHSTSINSNSRTKTVQFSHNEYSAELIKISQRVSAVQDVVVNEHIEPLNLLGSGTHPLEGSGESSGPLGFEAFKPPG